MLLDQIKSTIQRFSLIKSGDRILVGVSGGPDSVVLLWVLNSLKKELNITLHVAHLDHMLRIDSHKDSEFVRNLAAKFKLPFSSAEINVAKLASRGSLEEIARNARFDFLARTAGKVRANKIALGHNLDDQAETVLLRILRGAGLYGLSAILPKRKFGAIEVIRPLIETKRKDIETFLKRRKFSFRIDPSNFQDIYFRNKVRNKLIPLLEKSYSSKIKDILGHTAESASFDYDYLIIEARRILKRMNYKIKLNQFSRLHPAMRRLILRLSINRLKNDTRAITFQHIKEIEDLIFNRPLNSVVDLPKGISVIKKKKTCLFYRKTR